MLLNHEEYLVIDPFFYRPDEETILVANTEKVKKKIGWDPKVSFENLALMMVKNDYDLLKKRI